MDSLGMPQLLPGISNLSIATLAVALDESGKVIINSCIIPNPQFYEEVPNPFIPLLLIPISLILMLIVDKINEMRRS